MAAPSGGVVLSLGKLSLGQEAYYLSEVLDGAEDYYLNAGEAPGRWTGRGAAGLGLTGPVGAEEVRAVLSGKRPDGTPLRATRACLPGIDVTAHEAAVDSALGYLGAQACHVRRGHGGVDVISANGFVAAAFRHRTSRAGDPTLHSHVLVSNMAQGSDGRWTALDTTIHKAQGRSVDRVFVLGDDSFSTESGYTALTRGRHANAVYLVSAHRDDGHGLAPELDPVVAFARALGRSSAKTAAIDHLGPQAPIPARPGPAREAPVLEVGP
ncbi:MAG: relaxase domain-containing protein [Acidimicrobiales bacterium]